MRITRERVCYFIIVLGLLADWSLTPRAFHAGDAALQQVASSIAPGAAFDSGSSKRFVF